MKSTKNFFKKVKSISLLLSKSKSVAHATQIDLQISSTSLYIVEPRLISAECKREGAGNESLMIGLSFVE